MASSATNFEPGEEEKAYRISELAKEFDVTLRTLRFYEDKGLLSPRRVGTRRLYSRTDRARLKLILLGKRLGFPLVDLKDFLELYNPAENNRTQLQFALDKGLQQRETLMREREKIDESLKEMDGTLDTLRTMIAQAQ